MAVEPRGGKAAFYKPQVRPASFNDPQGRPQAGIDYSRPGDPIRAPLAKTIFSNPSSNNNSPFTSAFGGEYTSPSVTIGSTYDVNNPSSSYGFSGPLSGSSNFTNNRDTRSPDNPNGYNKRQLAALDLAYQSSPDKARLDAENVQRAKEGKSPIQTTAGGLNYFHTVTDPNTGITTRDFNYSSDGQYRGPIPDEFKNKPGNPNTHDAHFNKETGKWEAGDLSITQTFRDISKGFSDAYTNIGNTLPLMGKEVVNAVFKAPPVVKSSGGKNTSNALKNEMAKAQAESRAQIDNERDSYY